MCSVREGVDATSNYNVSHHTAVHSPEVSFAVCCVEKVAFAMPESTYVIVRPESQLNLRADRSYLVTGGASGLGLRLARFLVEQGAKHIVLGSWLGPNSADDNALLLDIQRLEAVVKIERAKFQEH